MTQKSPFDFVFGAQVGFQGHDNMFGTHRMYQEKQNISADTVKIRSNFDLIIIERTINPNTLAAHESIFIMNNVRFQRMSQISELIMLLKADILAEKTN